MDESKGQPIHSSVVIPIDGQVNTQEATEITCIPQHTTIISKHGNLKWNTDVAFLPAREIRMKWIQHVSYARAFCKVEEEVDGFQIYHPLLCGFPDAAIVSLVEDGSLSKTDIILASLAADNPQHTLFENCFLHPTTALQYRSKHMRIADVTLLVSNYTERCYAALGSKRWFHSHCFKEVSEDLKTLPGADDVWDGGRRQMIEELTEWQNKQKQKAELTYDKVLRIPEIESHFDVIDVLLSISCARGEVCGLNPWRLILSGNPLRVDDPIEYAIRTTYLPTASSDRFWAVPRFTGRVRGKYGNPLANHFMVDGGADGGFQVGVHTPAIVSDLDLKMEAMKRNAFWNASAARQRVRDDLRALHRVASTMLLLSARWDGVIDLPLGEVTHRVCARMPSLNSRDFMKRIKELEKEHRLLANRITKAADFDVRDIENRVLIVDEAARKLTTDLTTETFTQLALGMTVHEQAKRIIMVKTKEELPDMNTPMPPLEDVMIPRLNLVHSCLYDVVEEKVYKAKVEEHVGCIDEMYCKKLMDPDDVTEDEMNQFVDKRGFRASRCENVLCVTLNRPKQALVVYKLSEDFLTNDTSALQPVEGDHTALDMIKACILTSCMGVMDRGDSSYEFSLQRDGLSELLSEVSLEGLVDLRARTVDKVRPNIERARQADTGDITLLWSDVKKWVESYSSEKRIELNPWIMREIACIIHVAMGTCSTMLLDDERSDQERPLQCYSFVKLLESMDRDVDVEYNEILGCLLINDRISITGMKHSAKRDWIRTRKGAVFDFCRSSRDEVIVGSEIEDKIEEEDFKFQLAFGGATYLPQISPT